MDKESISYNDDYEVLDIEDTNSYDKINVIDNNMKKLYKNRFRLILGSVLLLLFIIFIIVFVFKRIPKLLHDYDIFVEAPETIYMGESATINVESIGNDKTKEKNNYFELNNDYLFYVLDHRLTGNKVSNTIVPISEGTGGIDIFSSLKDVDEIRDDYFKAERVNITVCPSFNSDLLMSPQLSVVKGTYYQLNTDFGLGECSKDIIYKSNNNSIMTVTDSGLIKGIKPGKTELVISKTDKTFIVPVTVTDNRVKVTAIDVDHSKLQLMPGENFRLNINQLPSNSTSINVKCISSDNKVAIVTDSGLISAKAPGVANITISYGNIKKTVSVVVNDVGMKQTPATSIYTDKEQISLKKGDSYKIYTLVEPDSAINRLNKWDSSNYNIVVTDYNGVIYAKNTGTAHITVKNGKVLKTIKVIVNE